MASHHPQISEKFHRESGTGEMALEAQGLDGIILILRVVQNAYVVHLNGNGRYLRNPLIRPK
jgi:hypothetical protein